MDKTIRSIVCDTCESERIIDSSNPATYTLQLKAINTGINTTGVQYAIAIHPPIPATLHFCDLNCLKEWVGKI